MKAEYAKARELVNQSRNILIISHRKPDADTLGSAIVFKILLEKEGRKTKLACVDNPSKSFKFLPYVDEFMKEFDLAEHDLIMILDAGASYMTDFHLKYEDLFTCGVPIINIDHHASNDNYGQVNIVDSTAASTTVILYRMLEEWGIEIDEDMATCLLAGIYGDTGSFMHANTNQEVYTISEDLMNKGAQIAEIGKNLFNTNSVVKLRLWGKVMEKAFVTSENVVMSVIDENDYDSVGANPNQLSGVIDYLNMVPDSKFAVLINEDKDGNVKGSFRTQQESVDLSRIAAVFGGGGHRKASGFSLPGKIEKEIRYRIVSDDMSKKSLEF